VHRSCDIKCTENQGGQFLRKKRRTPFSICIMRPSLRPTALNLAVPELQAEIQRRGILMPSLAKSVGYSSRSLGRHIGAGVPNWRLRWAIERALDFHPLWSQDCELWARRQCVGRFGSDPRLLTLGELKALCQKIGCASPGIRQREAWFQALAAWLAAHPQVEKTIEATNQSNPQS
jgi:lambda repressor-like predicted transcriptional regulator